MNDLAPDCCANSKTPLLSVKDALSTLLNSVSVQLKKEQVSIADARGRVLAQPVHSLINVPAFDNSAMDGYAIKINPSSPTPWRFKLTQRIAAGSIGSIVNEGEAARIFTGAPVPVGANAVVMQEEVSVENDDIMINRQVSEKENIRPLGNDIKINECVLEQGKRLQAHHIALAASVGLASLEVYSRLTVGVFFTGDELVQPGETLPDGKIYNSNQYTLIHLLQTLGCEVISLGQVEDSLPSTVAALKQLQDSCDLMMTTGGVSVGEEDHVKPAVEQLGQLELWRIAMKPGKPLAFGTVGKTPFIGLPGNPVSAMVTFMLFARPTILKMMGVEKVMVEPQKTAIDFDWSRKKPRREYVRVQIDKTQMPPKAHLFSRQGSDVLSSIAWADGLVEIPEQQTFKAGDVLNFFPFSELLT